MRRAGQWRELRLGHRSLVNGLRFSFSRLRQWGESPIAPFWPERVCFSVMKKSISSPNGRPTGPHPPAAAAAFHNAEVFVSQSRDEVARRAYFIYLNQGSRDGDDVEHWFEAESELANRHEVGCRNRTV